MLGATEDDPLSRARTGDTAALTALILAHQRSVYSLALRMLGDRDSAEDLTQEVFMQMSQKLQSIESEAHLTFWLRRVATHRAIDQLRRRARFQTAPLEDAEPLLSPVAGGDPLLRRHLGRLMQELPPAARAVLLLRFQEDLDPQDIARTLDMPLNTVKSHLKRALDAIRLKLAGVRDLRNEETSP